MSPVGGQFASPCQISSKSVKRLRRYGDLTVFFKMAAVRHLGFWKFKFFNGLPNFAKIGQSAAVISRYLWFFKDGGRRHLSFRNIRNCNCLSPVWGKLTSPCQTSSKSAKRLLRYDDLTVFFKMAAVRHLGFWKFKFFNCQDG